MGARRSRGRAGALLALVTTGGLLLNACTASPESHATPGTTTLPLVVGGELHLAALEPAGACDDVLRYFKDEALKRVGPYGLPMAGATAPAVAQSGRSAFATEDATVLKESAASAPASAPPGHSTTNVQEKGVDEPDIMKSDGRRLITVQGTRIHVVDTTKATPTLVSTIDLPDMYGAKLLLQGDHLLVLSSNNVYGSQPMILKEESGSTRAATPGTRLVQYDIKDPAHPRIVDEKRIDSELRDARMIDGRAHLAFVDRLPDLPFLSPTTGTEANLAAAKRANEEAIRNSTIENWLPRVHDRNAPANDEGRLLVACEDFRKPKVFSGLDTLAVLSLNVDRDTLDLDDTVGVMASGHTVYASATSLYVATTPSDHQLPTPWPGQIEPAPMPTPRPVPDITTGSSGSSGSSGSTPGSVPGTTPGTAPGTTVPPAPPTPQTAIHAFTLDPTGPARYRGSGAVDGTLHSSYSLSEHDKHLRVVHTIEQWACRDGCVTETKLTVLAERDGQLVSTGSVGDMGKGEQVKAVRFAGDQAYVVTFRQIDPFYVVDLRDPSAPRVAGELKIPGFSSYLHSLGNGLVLGVGIEGGNAKTSLFDVKDPSAPKEIARHDVPSGAFGGELDPHAFLWWASENLALIPMNGYQVNVGAVGLEVEGGRLTERGWIRNEVHLGLPAPVLRTAIVGDTVFALSESGISANDLRTLGRQTWIAFAP